MKKNKKGIDSWGYWKEFATQAQLSTFFSLHSFHGIPFKINVLHLNILKSNTHLESWVELI